MRVTSIHHMYPGTTVHEATIFGDNNRNGFIDTKQILTWPKAYYMLYGGYLSDFYIVRKMSAVCENGFYETDESLDDSGIPHCTCNAHATFTTRKEAEQYLASFIK